MTDLMNGAFGQLLTRSNKQLRSDRGLRIVKATEKHYRREIEDLESELEQLEVDRDNLMDINPGNTQSIINPTDFDVKGFVDADLKLGLRIRDLKIKLGLARERYTSLFTIPETSE